MIEQIDIKEFYPDIEFKRPSTDYCIGIKLPYWVNDIDLQGYLLTSQENGFGHFIKDGYLWRTTKNNIKPEDSIIALYKKQNIKVLMDFKERRG